MLIQSIIGSAVDINFIPTPVDPGGGVSSIANSTAGLFRRKWNGYAGADSPAWFDTAPTPLSTVADSTLTMLAEDNYSGFTLDYVGYFFAPATGTYRFSTTSDDGSYLWIGTNAISGYTTSNANINNGGPHGDQLVISNPVLLSANTYYPIRIQYYDSGGGWTLITKWEYNLSVTFSTDFTNLVYHNSGTNGL